MFRGFVWCVVLGVAPLMYGQGSSQSSPSNTSSPASSSSSTASGDRGSKPVKNRTPDLSPPRSDRVNAGDLADEVGESSSKETQIDLSAPADDAKTHPQSSAAVMDAAGAATGGSSVGEFHPWDPHKAAKSVEVGDFYFKRKNYRAAEDRYREALLYKDNDAIATYRLAVCMEKLERPDDARAEYESYLKILPHGPQAEDARKAVERLKGPAASSTTPK